VWGALSSVKSQGRCTFHIFLNTGHENAPGTSCIREGAFRRKWSKA
jgi:hypothetical protein